MTRILYIYNFCFRETWVDFEEYLNLNQDPINDSIDSSNSYLPIIEFIVDNIFLTENNELLFNKMNSILDMIKITCLDIHSEKISIRILKNLNSIRISDLSLHKPMDLCVEDVMILNEFLKINKIRKLILRNTFTVEQIDLIINLFPRIRYFGLEDVLDVNLETYVRCILLNIKENNIFHPMMIYIVSVDAKYDQVERLYQMIDSENLLKNYTIHRQLNRFYVQWK